MRRFLVFTALAAACGSPPSSPPPPPAPGTPAVHFLVDDAPQRAGHEAVESAEARYGDPFDVVVDGLPSGRASIVAHMNGMVSKATFVVAADGSVDLARDAPVAGTWQGVDPEGILWSMTQDDPVPATLDLAVNVSVVVNDAEVATGSLARRYIDDGLTVEPVSSGRTVGALVIPPGDGPFPAVLTFGGSEGGTGTGEFDAQYLGSLGYAALGIGYFGAPGLPQTLSNVPLEILEEDLAFLTADPRVDPERIAVMGGSRGGELALLLGAHFPVVKAVIADVPSGLVWGGTTSFSSAAWTLGGAPVPFVPYSGGQPAVTVDDSGAQHVSERALFLADIAAADPVALAAATTHVEDTRGPILLLAADADQLWPSCVLAKVAFDRLTEHARRYRDESHCYPDAGHLIGTPGWSTVGSDETYAPDFGAYLVTGGTPRGQGAADRASDTAIRGFLEENL